MAGKGYSLLRPLGAPVGVKPVDGDLHDVEEGFNTSEGTSTAPLDVEAPAADSDMLEAEDHATTTSGCWLDLPGGKVHKASLLRQRIARGTSSKDRVIRLQGSSS